MRKLAIARCWIFFPATVAVITVRREAFLVLAIRTSPRVLVLERCLCPIRSAFQVQKIEAVDALPDFFVMLHLFQADTAFQQVLLNLSRQDLMLVFIHLIFVPF